VTPPAAAASRPHAAKLAPARAGFDPNHPPYLPGGFPLDKGTMAPDAVHSIGLEYNAHPLYGYLESRATKAALDTLRQTRSVVITRSTVAVRRALCAAGRGRSDGGQGSGHYVGHWTGDNFSTYGSMRSSIASTNPPCPLIETY
jgi:hypothetical protein